MVMPPRLRANIAGVMLPWARLSSPLLIVDRRIFHGLFGVNCDNSRVLLSTDVPTDVSTVYPTRKLSTGFQGLRLERCDGANYSYGLASDAGASASSDAPAKLSIVR